MAELRRQIQSLQDQAKQASKQRHYTAQKAAAEQDRLTKENQDLQERLLQKEKQMAEMQAEQMHKAKEMAGVRG